MNYYKWLYNSILNSYSQVFFSVNPVFALLLIVVSFFDVYAGLAGMGSVLFTIIIAQWFGLDRDKIQQGYYGFNSLLVGLGIGMFFQPGLLLLLLIFSASVLTLFISVSMEGIIGKYALPYLSIPFLVSMWSVMLATRDFHSLYLNERGIYRLNEWYSLGGLAMVNIYEWFNQLHIPFYIKTYFFSLGAIFFQPNVLSGLLIALGLLYFSRIAFVLSFIGYSAAFIFNYFAGVELNVFTYSYIGFNFILTAIAIGGFYTIPGKSTFLWIVGIIPVVVILTISLSKVFAFFILPVYSLPFNIATLLFLYVLKFRVDNPMKLYPVTIQENSPEKNLYSFINYKERFGLYPALPVALPFHGEWTITQGHQGEYTHQGLYMHAWDFEITDDDGKTFKNAGDVADDYFCYAKNIIAPADGIVELVVDSIEDNPIGKRNLENNWGNTIVIRHSENLYSSLSHFQHGSIVCREGQKVSRGDLLGKCGNSGNSPYPHLHFQLQSTPYIGSATLEYPISNYLLHEKDNISLKYSNIPLQQQKLSNIPVNTILRNAFKWIPGMKTGFLIENQHTSEKQHWEIKTNYLREKWIECEETQSKAYFFVDETIFYFTHFEGDKKSLLYYFYLAFFRVCLSYKYQLHISDTFPLNKVFSPARLFLQDFLAPFTRFLKAQYSLEYLSSHKNQLMDTSVILNSKLIQYAWGRKTGEMSFNTLIDQSGIIEFNVISTKINLKASCINDI